MSRRRGKWRRRFLWCGAAFLILGVAFRLSLPWLLPWTLQKVADGYDLDCKYERLELSFLGGNAELWHFTVAPREGGQPFVHAEYCRADLATPYLLLGRIVVRRVEADGIDLLVEREEDGQLALLRRIQAAQARKQPPAEPPAPPAQTGEPPPKPTQDREIDLSSPVRVDAMRLQLLHATLRDRSVHPPFETRFDLNVRLSDLASKERPVRFEVEAQAPPLLDAFTIEGEGTSEGARLVGTGKVRLAGLRPKAAAAYLEPLGLRPVAGEIALEGQASLETGPEPPESSPAGATPAAALRGKLKLAGMRVTVDGKESAALDAVVVDLLKLSRQEAILGDVIIAGGRVAAERTGEGLIRALGIEVAPGKPAESGAGAPRPSPPEGSPPPAPPTPPAGTPFRLRLASLGVSQLVAAFEDRAVTPPASLGLRVEEATARNLVIDPDRVDAPVELFARLSVPGVIREIRIEGTATPLAPRKELHLTLASSGISPGGLAQYLVPLGIEATVEDGTFTTSLEAGLELGPGGTLRADLALGKSTFASPGQGAAPPFLELGGAAVAGVSLDPAAGELSVREITLTGPALRAVRNRAGAIEVLGLRVGAPPPTHKPAAPPSGPRPASQSTEELGAPVPAVAHPADARPEPAVPPGERPPAASPPLKVSLEKLVWKDLKLDLRDEVVEPPVELSLEELLVELSGLAVLLGPGGTGKEGQLSASFKSPGLAESVRVTGTVLPQPTEGRVKLELDASGLALDRLTPYLKPAGLEPELAGGRVRAGLTASYSVDPRGVHAEAAVTGVTFTQGETELAGLDALRVSGLDLGKESIRLALLEIDQPRARASRDAEGHVHAAGLRVPHRPSSPAPRGEEPAPEPTPAPGQPAPPAGPEPAGTAPPPRIELGKLALRSGSLSWNDAAAREPVATSLTANVSLEQLVMGAEAPPARLEAAFGASGSLDELKVSGTVGLPPGGPHTELQMTGRGIKAGPLAGYLPPGLSSTLKDGRLRAALAAAVAPAQGGGTSVSLTVTDVDYRDGESAEAHFKLGAFKVAAPRIDPEGGRVEIDEVSLGGVELSARRTESGAVEVLGLSLTPAPAVAQEKEAPGPAEPPRTTPPPAVEVVAVPAPTGQATAAPAVARRQKLPLVILRQLDLGLERLAVTDARSPGGRSLVTTLRLTNPQPIQLLGEDPEALQPIGLVLAGKVDPLLDDLLVQLTAAPFAKEPDVRIQVDLQGIQGKDLTAVLPDLAGKIDGAGLRDGRFQARLESSLKFQRRNALDFDVSRGFGASLVLENVHFKNGKEAPVSLGLDGLRVEVARIEPGTGAVRVKEIEIQRPILETKLTREGIELLGLVVKVPEPTPAAESAPAEPPRVEPTPAPTPAPATPGEPPPELKIDKLVASGLDVRVADLTTDPPTTMWLDGLDVDVRNATNRILTEPVSTRFQVSLQAGKVPLPVPLKGSFLGGTLSDTAALISGQGVDTAKKLEERVPFEDVTLSGKVGLYPNPTGWVDVRLGAFDMTAVKGLAARSGVMIENGIFDLKTAVRLPGDGSTEVDARLKFTDLDVSEPPDGPIIRYLKLPTPINAVVFTLRDEEGTIGLSVPLKKEPGPFGSADVGHLLGAVPGIVGGVLSDALLAAAKRAALSVVSLVPVPAGEEQKPEPPLVLELAPGDARLSPSEALRLAPLLERLKQGEPLSLTITHEFGAEDLRRSAQRANPSPAECLELGARLRRQRADLHAEREDLAARAAGAVGSQVDREARALLESLRSLDRQLAETDAALDHVYGLTRSGADRQAPRRTREAAVELARARVEEVKALLLASNAPEIKDAVRAPRPAYVETAPEGSGKVKITVAPRRSK